MAVRSVWKYELPVQDISSIEVPKGAAPLRFGFQGMTPFVWALVKPDEEYHETRWFRLCGTGHDINVTHDLYYIGTDTLQTSDGVELVFHLFEIAGYEEQVDG